MSRLSNFFPREFALSVNGLENTNRELRYLTGGESRWILAADAVSETGNNAGSNFDLRRFDDTGTLIDTPLTINRSTGNITLKNDVSIGDGVAVQSDATFSLGINGLNATNRSIEYRTEGDLRWEIKLDSSPEEDVTAPLVPTKLADPATLPTGRATGVAFSLDGTHMAIAHDISPFVTIYSRSGDTFTKLPNPAVLPTGDGRSVSFSLDGTHLAVGHVTTPFITIYERNGNTFTKVADPATLPTGTGNGVAFSPDGVHLAITHSTTPFITIYERSGNTFTKLADPATLPAGTGNGVTFSLDGTHLAVAHDTSPFITIYERSGNTFTKLANPATLPTGTGTGAGFSYDGTHLAVGHVTTPFITIYERNGNTFTKVADPATLPTGTGRGTAFSPDNKHLTVAHNTAPFITVYSRSNNEFVKLADPATLPTGQGFSAAFLPEGTHLAVAHDISPFVTIYDSPVGVNTNGGSDFSIKRYGDNGAIIGEPIKISRETGEMTLTGVTTINNGPLAGFRNALINGNFDIWQRGTTFNTSSPHTADRWRYDTGDGVGTVSRQSFTLGQTDVPGEPVFFLRHDRTTASTVGNIVIEQRLEGVRSFAGQTVTFSFYAKAAATKTFDVDFIQFFGTGGTPSATVDGADQTFTVTTAWQKFTFTFSVSSISGKTIGTDGNDWLAIRVVEQTSFSTFTLDFAQAQVELGSVATEFERRPIGTELALAQRYFQRFKSLTESAGNVSWVTAYASDATRLETSFPHTTVMRAAPIGSFSGLVWGLGANNLPNSVISVVNARHLPGASWYYFAVTGATVDVNYVIGFSDFNGFFDLDAEL